MAKEKTTLMVDADVLKAAKKLCIDLNETLSRFVEESIRERVRLRGSKPNRKPFHLPTHGSGGLMPGVDLTNNEALRELLEEENGRWSSLM